MHDEPWAELTWTTVDVPLERPVRAGRLVIDSRQYCCVRVRLAGGALGESFVLTRGLDVAGEIRRRVVPWLMGESGGDIDRLRVGLRNVGWDGAISRAAAAVSLALLDARARAELKPVWRLLDPAPRMEPRVELRVPAGVAIGYVPVDAEPGDTDVAEAVRAAADGVAWVKLMGGHGEPDVDLARVRRVRRAVGDACGVALDVNGAWPAGVALSYLPRLADEGVSFVEEPWPYELGLDAFDRLSGVQRPPLAFGEVSASVIELEALAATGCVAYVRPDATVLGGGEMFTRALPAFEAHRCTVLPHFWPEVHRHLVAAYPGQSVLECVSRGAGGFGLERFVQGVAEVRDGVVAVPDTPGFGYQLDWTAVTRMSTSEPAVLSNRAVPWAR